MTVGGAVRRSLAVLALLAVTLAVTGCGLLFPPDLSGLEDPYSTEPPLALYKTGEASITLGDGTKIVLDRVAADSTLDAYFGATVHWTGKDGWHARLSGASVGGSFGSYAYVTLDRITDGEHWTIWDSGRCIVDLELADEKGVRGSATCKGLEWYDAMAAPFPGLLSSATPGVGEPKFDAEIEFEAFPAADAA